MQHPRIVCGVFTKFDMHSNNIHDQLCGLTATDTH